MFDTNAGSANEFGGTHANFVAPVDTDSDGRPDYIETDSDGDGATDTVESGLTSDFNDSDGDGIADDLNTTYSDPDGDVHVPIDDLENSTDNDPLDADYRSVNRQRRDGVSDFEDLDDDNDGILDTVETEFVLQFDFNATTGDADELDSNRFYNRRRSLPFNYGVDGSGVSNVDSGVTHTAPGDVLAATFPDVTQTNASTTYGFVPSDGTGVRGNITVDHSSGVASPTGDGFIGVYDEGAGGTLSIRLCSVAKTSLQAWGGGLGLTSGHGRVAVEI